jgi:radical SAM superfamily enzyme YgiQ (UPF0313 family)
MIKDLILLCAVNSTYQHAAFGLRYLKANLKELSESCLIHEFTIAQDPKDIAEKILSQNPKIVGFGVYIWNTLEVLETIKIIKKVAPEIIIVLGGPEISYETEQQEHVNYANFIIQGEADLSFYQLCKDVFNNIPAAKKIIPSQIPDINLIQLPYDLYTAEDIKNRVIYVEASRGCPYKCEYCLSSLDKAVRNFDLDIFLSSMKKLMDAGVREYKFVDRTFNLSPKISQSILLFFLEHIEKNLFLHFEMVPDRLPDELKELIKKFPEGSLQFEVGIQTLNEDVSKNVSRRQNVDKIKENFLFLKTDTHVHTHADLIVGLPGESIESFKHGFNRLIEMSPDEIQVGILKRLRGTPIVRHDKTYSMIYSEKPPYQILQSKDMSFSEIQKMIRFSKHWDMVANSGNWKCFLNEFKNATEHQSFFDTFLDFSSFLSDRHQNTHGISLINLAESIFWFMQEKLNWPTEKSVLTLLTDYCFNKKRDIPPFLKNNDTTKILCLKLMEEHKNKIRTTSESSSLRKRQAQHLQ